MPRFLTQEWLDEVLASFNPPDSDPLLHGVDLTLQQVVTDAPDGEVEHWTSFVGGEVTGGLGRATSPDVTIVQDYETGSALARGELNFQAAFMQGRLKITGNMGKLLQSQSALQALGSAMASLETQC